MATIYGVSPSPFVRKVRVFLAEKGVPHELVMQPPFNQSDEYLAKSPLGKVPCYEDGEFVLPDSSCIAAYLERVHPEPALYPSDPQHFARALWYEEYADSKLAEACGGIFFNRVVKPKILKQESDEAVVKASLEALPALFHYLEGELEEGSGALVGGRLSIADIAVCSQLAQLRHVGETIDGTRWPRLAAYSEAILARPSFQEALKEDAAMLQS